MKQNTTGKDICSYFFKFVVIISENTRCYNSDEDNTSHIEHFLTFLCPCFFTRF
jgi:hypothetical protein